MNKKKLLALLMALVMTLSLIPTTVWADDTPSEQPASAEVLSVPKATVTALTVRQATEMLTETAYDSIPFHPGLTTSTQLNGTPLAIRLFTSDSHEPNSTKNYFENWYADFAVSFNKPMEAKDIDIGGNTYHTAPVIPVGYYEAFSNYIVGLAINKDLTADEDFWLLADGMGFFGEGFASYPYIRDTVHNFFCGAVLIDDNFLDQNSTYSDGIAAYMHKSSFPDGLKMSVKLRLYSPSGLTEEDVEDLQAKIGEDYQLVKFNRNEEGDRYYIDVESSTFDITPNNRENAVARIGTAHYTTLEDAIAAANSGDTITLLADVTVNTGASSSSRLPISKSMTIDGGDHTIIINNRGFGVGMNASSDIDVTFKDVTIKNSTSGARCIDTRGNLNSLTLDNVTLSTDGAPSGYTQPLTIGGSASPIATINITNSTIKTNDDATEYYAIITFNPVNMNISNSTIKGWACIYAKAADSSAGSAGSVFNINNSTLESKNRHSGTTNAFAMFVSEDNNVTFNVSGSTLLVETTGDQDQAIATTENTNVNVSLGEGNTVEFNGDKATFALNSANLFISGGLFNEPVPETCCAAGYIPAASSNSTYPHTVKPGTYVAQVGTTKYETLEAATAAAPSGATVKLIADIDYSTIYTERNARDYGREHVIDLHDLTLDMNSHTISTINATVEFCGNGATIKNGTFNLVPKNTDGSYKDGSYALIIDNNGASAGTVLVQNVVCNGGINLCSATVTLDNVTARTTPTKYYAVWAETNATVTILSGTYTDEQTGGKGVLATGTKTEGGAKIYVTGGSYNADNKVVASAEANSIQITGGIFSKEPAADYIATGYQVIANPDETTHDTYPHTVGVIEDAFKEVKDAENQNPVTNTSGDTTFSFATATTENPNDDVTYAIKTTTTGGQDNQVAYTPVQTDVVTKPAVSQNAANVSSTASETTVNNAKAAVEESAASGTTEIQAKQGNTNVDLLTTQAAAKAITKAAAAYTGAANDIAKVEIQLQTELTSYTLADENNSVVTTALIYQVTPKAVLLNASGVQLGDAETLTNDDLAAQGLTLQFQLPVPDSAVTNSKKVNVTHRSLGYEDSTFVLDVLGEAGNYYVVIETTHFSEFELEPVVVADSDCAKVLANLTLTDDIAINFDVSKLTYAASRYTVEYSFNGEETITKNLTAFPENNGHFKVTVAHCAAKQMTDTVCFELKLNGNSIDKKLTDYSVQKYCLNAFSQNPNNTSLRNLCYALLNYGTYAQYYFDGYNPDKLANDITVYGYNTGNIPDADDITRDEVYHFDGNKPANSSCNINLTLVDKTEMNFTFSNLNDTDKFSVTQVEDLDNESFTPLYEPSKSGSTCTVKIKGIPAKYLNHQIKLSYQYDGDSHYIIFSPLSYVYLKKDQSSDYLGQLCRALYGYWAAANNHFITQSN